MFSKYRSAVLFAAAIALSLGQPALARYDGTPGSTIVQSNNETVEIPAGSCIGPAYRGRHESCCRQRVDLNASIVPKTDYTAIRYTEKCAQLDRIERQEDWQRQHPMPALIGMSADQVKNETSWGKPDHINRTLLDSGTKEQWVYRDRKAFLYFENGKLVAVQTSDD